MAIFSSKMPDVEVSRVITNTISYSETHPNGITGTVAYSQSTKDSFKVPVSSFFGTNMPGGGYESWKGKSSEAAYGPNMPGKSYKGMLGISDK